MLHITHCEYILRETLNKILIKNSVCASPQEIAILHAVSTSQQTLFVEYLFYHKRPYDK